MNLTFFKHKQPQLSWDTVDYLYQMYQSSHIFHANVCKKILSMTHLHCGTNLIFPLHHLTQPSQNCSPACNEQIPEASEGNIRGVNKGSMFHSCWMWVIACNLLKTTRIELTATNQNSDSADCYFGGMYYKNYVCGLDECLVANRECNMTVERSQQNHQDDQQGRT